MNKYKEIIKKAKELLNAIDLNIERTILNEDRGEMPIIPLQYINEELEELRELLK